MGLILSAGISRVLFTQMEIDLPSPLRHDVIGLRACGDCGPHFFADLIHWELNPPFLQLEDVLLQRMIPKQGLPDLFKSLDPVLSAQKLLLLKLPEQHLLSLQL